MKIEIVLLCFLGNMITDAMVVKHLREPDEIYWSNVTMAIINSGSVRSSINAGRKKNTQVLLYLPHAEPVCFVLLL